MSSTVATTAGLLVSLLAYGFSRAPGWERLRGFALISLAMSGFTGTNLGLYLLRPEIAVWMARAQLSFVGLHAMAWVVYLARAESRTLLRWERVIIALAAVVTVLPLMGSLVLLDQLQTWTAPSLGTSYVGGVATHVGEACYVVYLGSHVAIMARVISALRHRAQHALTHAIGLGCLLTAGFNDAIVNLNIYPGPYLLDFGFLCLVISSGTAVARDFIDFSRQLDVLSATLERQVEERTAQLTTATEALARSEKLAAIGQLAAGVAHEINNPAAVVKANLGYLTGELKLSRLPPPDVNECMSDSLAAIDRIARIVRQLLDAGRVAGATESKLSPVSLRQVVKVALGNAVAVLNDHVEVEVDVPAELWAVGQSGLVEQVVTNLVVNAAQAITEAKRPGRIRVSGRKVGERAELSVSDDGPGIKPAAQPRVFEPFFTTRPIGQGSGLGLAVSLGLMRAQGGGLALVESSPSGTTMRLTLPWSSPGAAAPAETTARHGARLKVLLIDDEPLLRQALVRQLNRQFHVECADGVDSALKLLDTSATSFDAVVCDLVMPGGGGQRLLLELSNRAPSLAARTVMLTGGAVTDEQRRFIESLGDRVLYKPLDIALLRAQLDKLLRADAAAARPAS